jgi:hypothetical protein
MNSGKVNDMQADLHTEYYHEGIMRIKLCKMILALLGIDNLRLYRVNKRIYVSKM